MILNENHYCQMSPKTMHICLAITENEKHSKQNCIFQNTLNEPVWGLNLDLGR